MIGIIGVSYGRTPFRARRMYRQWPPYSSRSQHTRSSASGSSEGYNRSWDSSAMNEGGQPYYDTSDFHSTRSANDSSSRGLGTHYARNVSRSTAHGGQLSGAMDARYSFAGASSSAYAPTCDYVVPTTATSSLGASSSPRTVPTRSTDASIATSSRPSQKRPNSPSPEYINATLEPSTQLSDPASKPKLLILDLNGTLVFRSPHRRKDRSGKQFDPYADPTIKRALRPVHPRPFLSSLRRYMLHPETRKWLDIMVWSSAQPHSVADMVEQCFGNEKDQLAAIWARDTLGLSESDYHSKTQTTKDLAKPWAFFAPKETLISESRPSATDAPSSVQSRTIHSAHTTLLIDDSSLKAQLQPWNHMCIKEYVAEMRDADFTAALHLRQAIKEDLEVKEACSQATLMEEGFATGKEDDADGEAEQIAETSEGEGEPVTSSTRKRKRPHKKKLARAREQKRMASSVANDEGQTANGTEGITYHWWQEFDCTLLAVVGVLDAVKWESNIGAWVRQGGLWGSEAKNVEVSKNTKHLVPQSAETAESADIPCESSVETEGKNNDLNSQGPVGNREEVTGDVLMRRGLWFDDELTKAYWVARGVKALQELDIEVDAGIRVS